MPQRAVSKNQFAMFQAVAHGAHIPGVHMSAAKAAEMIAGQKGKSYSKLPQCKYGTTKSGRCKPKR